MFWGLIMEPGKKYSQVVEKDFHIAQAALDLDSAQNSPVQVLISIDGRNYLVCTLIKDKVCQANLDLNFRAGVKVSFATNGPGHVHLTGYLIEDNEYMMDEEDSDDEIEEEESADEEPEIKSKKRSKAQLKNVQPNKKTKTAMMLDQLDEESYNEDEDSTVNTTDAMDDSSDDDDDDDDDDEAEDEEMEDEDSDANSDEEESSADEEEAKPKVSPKKHQQESPKQNGVAKKNKNEKAQKGDKTQTPKGGDKSPKVEKTPKGQKTPNQENQKSPKNQQTPDKTGTPNKNAKKIEGGVLIEDLKVGEGPIAKSGRNVRVYYEGRLKSNNKVFDSSKQGTGFRFRLGKQEVIKGWDVGVAGMKVGGKRRITCPPHMAYGASGSPPVIPPNSTLVFEVELKQIS